MPPGRKGKQKAGEPSGYDEISEAASYQEGQATRYQFGDKAQRHYEEAARLYSLALEAAGSDAQDGYDATYNFARILYALATEIYGLPNCYNSLQEAIKQYRRCDPFDVQDKTDAAFNLAQALQTLGEWISGSLPSSSIHSYFTAEAIWREAQTVFEQVKIQQNAHLARSAALIASSSNSASQAESEREEAGTQMDEASAVEEQMVTPSTVIETILADVQVQLSLVEETGAFPANSLEQLLVEATQLDAQDQYMAKEIAAAQHDSVKAFVQAQLDTASGTIALDPLLKALEAQRHALTTERRPDPAGYSDLADTLLLLAEAGLRSGQGSVEDASAQFTEALTLYERARSTLNNAMQRPASTPAHHVPSLLSANYLSCATATFALATLRGSSEQAAQSQQLAIEALNAATGPFRAQQASAASPVKFTRALKSAAREDYRTIAASRDAILFLVRVLRLAYQDQSPAASEEQEKGCLAVLKAVFPDAADLEYALQTYFSDTQNDFVSWLVASRQAQ